MRAVYSIVLQSRHQASDVSCAQRHALSSANERFRLPRKKSLPLRRGAAGVCPRRRPPRLLPSPVAPGATSRVLCPRLLRKWASCPASRPSPSWASRAQTTTMTPSRPPTSAWPCSTTRTRTVRARGPARRALAVCPVARQQGVGAARCARAARAGRRVLRPFAHVCPAARLRRWPSTLGGVGATTPDSDSGSCPASRRLRGFGGEVQGDWSRLLPADGSGAGERRV